MGRSKPTFRNYLDRVEADWRPYRRTLRRRYQPDFDRLFEHARNHADAAGQLDPPDPRVAILLSMLLAQEHEHRELRERVEALESASDVDGDGSPGGEAPPRDRDATGGAGRDAPDRVG